MNAKRLARLAALRRRLRDQQSAKTAQAQAHLSEGERAHAAAEAAKQAFEAEARQAMLTMKRIDEMWWLERQAKLHEAHVAHVAEEVESRRALSDAARAQLRGLTKDVRVAELVLERLKNASAEAEHKREQRLVDDIVATEVGGEP